MSPAAYCLLIREHISGTVTVFQDIMDSELPDVKVGIGVHGDRTAVEACAKRFPGNVIIYDDADALVDDLVSGKIDAAVRGNMSSSVLLPILKRKLGLPELERIVLLEPKGGRLFCMAPVGIDEGWILEQKHDLVIKCMPLLKKLGMGSRIAIMSGGRCDDKGRNAVVDQTIDDGLALVDILRKEGYDAYDGQILIENIVGDADLVIAPEGISGNLIFRIMHFLAGAAAPGAPLINTDKVFIDTSRAKTDYTDSIVLAMKLTER